MSHIARTLLSKGYKIDCQIGEGSFATVYGAVHVKTNRDVAIKVVQKARLLEDDCPIHSMENEIAILKKIDFPLIAAYIEDFEDATCHYVVMEHAHGMSLLEKLDGGAMIMEDYARHYFAQLRLAFDYLHTHVHIAHRDIKPENIMIDAYDRVKLIDFGLAKDFSGGKDVFTTACGSIEYASPEMVSGNPYTVKSELWSLGVVLYAMVTGMLPFTDQNEVKTIRKILYMTPMYPKCLSPACVDLLSRMLVKDPAERISFEDVKSHEWIRDELNSPKWEMLTDGSLHSLGKELAEEMRPHSVCGGALSDCVEYRILRSEKISRFLSQPANDTAPVVPMKFGAPFPRMAGKPEVDLVRKPNEQVFRRVKRSQLRLTPKYVSPIAQFANEGGRRQGLLPADPMGRIKVTGLRVCGPPGRLW